MSAFFSDGSAGKKRRCHGSTRLLNSSRTFIAVLKNKAFALTNIHRFAEAFAAYEQMKAIDPANAEVDFDIVALASVDREFRSRLGRARSSVESSELVDRMF